MSALMDERRAVLQMRKHIAWYVKGMKGCNEFKREIFTISEMAVLIEKIKEYFGNDRKQDSIYECTDS
jgi:tRNA-dihydrouridine synthase